MSEKEHVSTELDTDQEGGKIEKSEFAAKQLNDKI